MFARLQRRKYRAIVISRGPDKKLLQRCTDQLQGIWRNSLMTSKPARRRRLTAVTVGLVLAIGTVDFLLGFEVSLLVFYCLPVVLGTATVNWKFGVSVAFASVGSWLVGDIAAGAHYGNWVIPWWNALIALGTYLLVVWLFSAVQTLQREMEERILQRTAALTEEIVERERLERVILEIGEKERSSIGRELHDDLGQHLTGTALAAQVLGEKLQANLADEQVDAWRIVRLVEEGIEKTRRLAKGLLLAEIERDGLREALHEYAATAADQFRIICLFRCDETTDPIDSDVATQFFRIAQESVRNAVCHGKAKLVEITIQSSAGSLILTVRDDGSGLPPPDKRGQGLGLRIMAYRAEMINASFRIEGLTGSGTLVECCLQSNPTFLDA